MRVDVAGAEGQARAVGRHGGGVDLGCAVDVAGQEGDRVGLGIPVGVQRKLKVVERIDVVGKGLEGIGAAAKRRGVRVAQDGIRQVLNGPAHEAVACKHGGGGIHVGIPAKAALLARRGRSGARARGLVALEAHLVGLGSPHRVERDVCRRHGEAGVAVGEQVGVHGGRLGVLPAGKHVAAAVNRVHQAQGHGCLGCVLYGLVRVGLANVFGYPLGIRVGAHVVDDRVARGIPDGRVGNGGYGVVVYERRVHGIGREAARHAGKLRALARMAARRVGHDPALELVARAVGVEQGRLRNVVGIVADKLTLVGQRARIGDGRGGVHAVGVVHVVGQARGPVGRQHDRVLVIVVVDEQVVCNRRIGTKYGAIRRGGVAVGPVVEIVARTRGRGHAHVVVELHAAHIARHGAVRHLGGANAVAGKVAHGVGARTPNGKHGKGGILGNVVVLRQVGELGRGGRELAAGNVGSAERVAVGVLDDPADEREAAALRMAGAVERRHRVVPAAREVGGHAGHGVGGGHVEGHGVAGLRIPAGRHAHAGYGRVVARAGRGQLVVVAGARRAVGHGYALNAGLDARRGHVFHEPTLEVVAGAGRRREAHGVGVGDSRLVARQRAGVDCGFAGVHAVGEVHVVVTRLLPRGNEGEVLVLGRVDAAGELVELRGDARVRDRRALVEHRVAVGTVHSPVLEGVAREGGLADVDEAAPRYRAASLRLVVGHVAQSSAGGHVVGRGVAVEGDGVVARLGPDGIEVHVGGRHG